MFYLVFFNVNAKIKGCPEAAFYLSGFTRYTLQITRYGIMPL